MALNLLTELSRYVTADIILDRILPYMVRNKGKTIRFKVLSSILLFFNNKFSKSNDFIFDLECKILLSL